MNFDSKETYLAARREWTTEYLDLSARIRKARTYYKQVQREGASVYKALGNYEGLKNQATEAISNLHAMKEEAAAQWQRAREKLAA